MQNGKKSIAHEMKKKLIKAAEDKTEARVVCHPVAELFNAFAWMLETRYMRFCASLAFHHISSASAEHTK